MLLTGKFVTRVLSAAMIMSVGCLASVFKNESDCCVGGTCEDWFCEFK